MPKRSTTYAYAPLEADETSTYPADLTPALQEALAILADLETYYEGGRSWIVGLVLRWSSSACLSSLRHAVSVSASRSCAVSLNSSTRSEARRCSKRVRFIDHALVSAAPRSAQFSAMV